MAFSRRDSPERRGLRCSLKSLKAMNLMSKSGGGQYVGGRYVDFDCGGKVIRRFTIGSNNKLEKILEISVHIFIRYN
jgi:hypothetical protein